MTRTLKSHFYNRDKSATQSRDPIAMCKEKYFATHDAEHCLNNTGSWKIKLVESGSALKFQWDGRFCSKAESSEF